MPVTGGPADFARRLRPFSTARIFSACAAAVSLPKLQVLSKPTVPRVQPMKNLDLSIGLALSFLERCLPAGSIPDGPESMEQALAHSALPVPRSIGIARYWRENGINYVFYWISDQGTSLYHEHGADALYVGHHCRRSVVLG